MSVRFSNTGSLGIGLFIYSFLTRYERGVFKVISMPYHLAIDIVAAVFLAVIFSQTQPQNPVDSRDATDPAL